MGTLYEIADNLAELFKAIEAGEIPEEAVQDTLDAAEGELADKIDNIACYIKQLQGEAAAIKTEEMALCARRKSKEGRADRLTRYLFDCLKRCGSERMETARSLVAIRKNPPAVQIADESRFVEWARENEAELLNFPAPKPDKTRIKEFLKAGRELPLCALVRGESLKVG